MKNSSFYKNLNLLLISFLSTVLHSLSESQRLCAPFNFHQEISAVWPLACHERAPMLTPDSALSHAPDDASKGNARALANPAKWKNIGAFDSDEGEVVWGEITGSDGSVYHTRVELEEPAFRCTCPSRKLPCKHSLGLLLLRAQDPSVFRAPPPEWALDEAADIDIQGLEIPKSWQSVLGGENRTKFTSKNSKPLFRRSATNTRFIRRSARSSPRSIRSRPIKSKSLFWGKTRITGRARRTAWLFPSGPAWLLRRRWAISSANCATIWEFRCRTTAI